MLMGGQRPYNDVYTARKRMPSATKTRTVTGKERRICEILLSPFALVLRLSGTSMNKQGHQP